MYFRACTCLLSFLFVLVFSLLLYLSGLIYSCLPFSPPVYPYLFLSASVCSRLPIPASVCFFMLTFVLVFSCLTLSVPAFPFLSASLCLFPSFPASSLHFHSVLACFCLPLSVHGCFHLSLFKIVCVFLLISYVSFLFSFCLRGPVCSCLSLSFSV